MPDDLLVSGELLSNERVKEHFQTLDLGLKATKDLK